MPRCMCGQAFALSEMVLAHQTYCPSIPEEKQQAKREILEFVTVHADKIIELTRQQEAIENA